MANARQFMAARTGAWTPSGAPLPYDTEVEYLEFTGNQYIDSGLENSLDGHIFSIGFAMTSASTISMILGGIVGDDAGAEAVRYLTTGLLQSRAQPFGSFSETLNVGEWHLLKLDGGAFLDGVNIGTWNQHGTAYEESRPIIGAALYSNGTVFRPAKMQLGNFYIANKYGAELRDLIAVRFKNSLGQTEGAMYDKVSGQLFRNAGTGAFIIGPDKTV